MTAGFGSGLAMTAARRWKMAKADLSCAAIRYSRIRRTAGDGHFRLRGLTRCKIQHSSRFFDLSYSPHAETGCEAANSFITAISMYRPASDLVKRRASRTETR